MPEPIARTIVPVQSVEEGTQRHLLHGFILGLGMLHTYGGTEPWNHVGSW
jgi:hypothetical protein